MLISIIAAMGRNRVIGRDNSLPWHLPADLQWFRKNTLGKPVIMGRKTFESIGRPLPGRTNIVLTRNMGYDAEGCIVVHSFEAALVAARELLRVSRGDEVVVIGGAQLFRQVLDRADRLYLTRIGADFDGDSYFPTVKARDWRVIWQEELLKSEGSLFDMQFLILERNKQVEMDN